MRIKRLLLIAIAALLAVNFVACGQTKTTKKKINYLPLYDESGLFSEENYIYNAALEKNGAHLIQEEKTEYRIRYEETTDESVLAAIGELENYFERICGGIPVEVLSGETDNNEIYIGKNIDSTITLQKTGAYVITIEKNRISICADNVYGLTNGIYGFMEDYLGCLFLDAESTYIPAVKTVIFEKGIDVQEPAFESRDVGDNLTWSNKRFAQKLRVRQDESFLTNGCHRSLGRIPKEILAEHPEYYAEINGERRTGDYMLQGPQLCFSNEEVIDLLEEAVVKEEQNKTTDQTVWWDISQQDSMNYCHCEKCAAITEETGNPAAPIFRCVNIIAKRHPELRLSTLAYHYGSTPPTDFTFEDNVMIKWCIMSSFGSNDYSAPLSESKSDIGKKQYKEILGWSELVDHIYVWDYITDFFYYQLPFPCLNAMQGNIQLLRECEVDGILTLSCYNARGSWDRLKANYAAHLLWNPDINTREFIGKFLTVYLGKDAAPFILEMYDLMHSELSSALWVYDFAFTHGENDYLSYENMLKYFDLWEKAAQSTADETYQKRLRYEKISLLYAAIAHYYEIGGTTEEMKEEMVALLDEFGITSLGETGLDKTNNYR